MNSQPPKSKPGLVSADQLRTIVGDLGDGKANEILDLRPTVAELEQAVVWASGDGDVLGQSGHPISQKIAAIVDILAADEDEPPPAR